MQFDRLKRREFILLLGGAASAWPLPLSAQPPAGMRRIGVLIALPEDEPEAKARLAAFQEGLARRGWSEGRNVRIDYRFAPAGTRAPELAKELIALQPDVIFAHSTPVLAALQLETRTIPIVFINVVDPVGQGFVATMTRPGSNVTGLTMYEASVTGKWLAMLKEIAPQLARVALVVNPRTAPYYNYYLHAAEALAPSLGIEPVLIPIENAAPEIERAIGSFARMPNGGLIAVPDSSTNSNRDLIIGLAAKHRLPAVYGARFLVAAGGLMSYGVVYAEEFRQAAYYVDRILRGDKPANLPVQASTKFETALNLKTAKALGLTVPPGLLVAADEVIE